MAKRPFCVILDAAPVRDCTLHRQGVQKSPKRNADQARVYQGHDIPEL